MQPPACFKLHIAPLNPNPNTNALKTTIAFERINREIIRYLSGV